MRWKSDTNLSNGWNETYSHKLHTCCCLNEDTIVFFIAVDLSSASQHHDCVFTLFQELHQKLRMQILYNGFV
jgi:hypothetical protein